MHAGKSPSPCQALTCPITTRTHVDDGGPSLLALLREKLEQVQAAHHVHVDSYLVKQQHLHAHAQPPAQGEGQSGGGRRARRETASAGEVGPLSCTVSIT